MIADLNGKKALVMGGAQIDFALIESNKVAVLR